MNKTGILFVRRNIAESKPMPMKWPDVRTETDFAVCYHQSKQPATLQGHWVILPVVGFWPLNSTVIGLLSQPAKLIRKTIRLKLSARVINLWLRSWRQAKSSNRKSSSQTQVDLLKTDLQLSNNGCMRYNVRTQPTDYDRRTRVIFGSKQPICRAAKTWSEPLEYKITRQVYDYYWWRVTEH